MLARANARPVLFRIGGKLERPPCRFREILHTAGRDTNERSTQCHATLAANHPLG